MRWGSMLYVQEVRALVQCCHGIVVIVDSSVTWQIVVGNCMTTVHLSHALVMTCHMHLLCALVTCTCHVHLSCALVMCTCHVHLSCALVMCTCHVHLSCALVMCTCHVHLSQTTNALILQFMNTFSALSFQKAFAQHTISIVASG